MTFRLLSFTSLVLFLMPNLAASRDLFVSVTTVGTETETSGTNSLTELSELFDDESLLALFGSTYVPGVSAVSAAVDLRGVAAQVGYAENSNKLVISVPSVGFTREFDGDDRDAAEEALQEWLDGNGDQ